MQHHQPQFKAWTGSHYQLAMQGAGAPAMLGDFEIKYAFGVTPLQQYLIEFPGGRYQPLGIAWDARPKSAGGQRWFHLYPNERIDHKDPLHWTGLYQLEPAVRYVSLDKPEEGI
jgi:hypothetical protein